MSLSRIVKKPSSVVFNDVVQIKEQIINSRPVHQSMDMDSDLSNQIVGDAQIEAQRMLDIAQEKINQLNIDFEQSCVEIESKIRENAYKQGYEDGHAQSQKDVKHQFETMIQSIENQLNEKNKLELNLIDELQNRTHLLALEIANKIMRQKIELDSSILKPILMDELETRKRQNIKTIEISKNANALILELENELLLLGIDLHTIDGDISHLVIEGEMGRYDLSIDTQLKNIRRLFNTI